MMTIYKYFVIINFDENVGKPKISFQFYNIVIKKVFQLFILTITEQLITKNDLSTFGWFLTLPKSFHCLFFDFQILDL